MEGGGKTLVGGWLVPSVDQVPAAASYELSLPVAENPGANGANQLGLWKADPGL